MPGPRRRVINKSQSTPRSFPSEATKLLKGWAEELFEEKAPGGWENPERAWMVVQRLLELQESIAEDVLCPQCHTDAPKVCGGCWDPATVCVECDGEDAVVCQKCR